MAHQAGADAAHPGARQLLRRHDPHELVGRHTAEFLGKAEPEQADLGGPGIERARKLAGLVPGAGIRRNLALDKAPDYLAKSLMLGRVEWAGHTRHVPRLRRSRRRMTDTND